MGYDLHITRASETSPLEGPPADEPAPAPTPRPSAALDTPHERRRMYRYPVADIPGDARLLERIDAAAGRLHRKLSRLDLSRIGISEYNQRYLGTTIRNLVGTLQLHGYLLSLVLAGSRTPLDDVVFVDYGGGSGLLSLLAGEAGIGRVIYNDVYGVSCDDARIVSQAIGVRIADFVCGDIDDLIAYARDESIAIDAVGSYDVIEHIYDIEDYLRRLRHLSTGPLRLVLASGANAKNPLYTRRMKKRQREFESRDRERGWGHKERDTLRSYLDVRREIIAARAPSLESREIDELARLTRGLIKRDIEKSVDEYRQRGAISYRPDHATNTCDPLTGNWAEHLMRTDWLAGVLREEGFEVKVLSGYWSGSSAAHKQLIKSLLNLAIKQLGSRALCLSPYYVLYAESGF